MPKTFLWKLTFFFWLSFFLVNIPIQLFGVSYIKDLLKSSEEEKISLMLYTLEPVIALNMSLNQEEELKKILNNIVAYDYISSLEITFNNGDTLHLNSKNPRIDKRLFTFETNIKDPFLDKPIATIKLHYHNTYLESLENELFSIFTIVFLSAALIFFIFLLFIREDLKALKNIALSLSGYLHTKIFTPIRLKQQSEEIMTIAEIANDVIRQNVRYVKVLEVFNNDLETKVNQKVAELKQQEELMIHQSRQAAMGEMLESIAHQWRQPLNIIGLATTQIDLAHSLKNMNEEMFNENIQTISHNINYMSSTIDDFRSFTQRSKETLSFSPEKSFEELLKILGAQLKNNFIHYDISVKDTVQINGIENEFKQVALIIVNNSIDAIKSQMQTAKHKNFSISVVISKENDKAIIKITDNGGGIKEDILDSIFTAYFTTKFASQGTGIGLYIVKNIIESRMNGHVEAQNVKDGCCFKISLPLASLDKEEK